MSEYPSKMRWLDGETDLVVDVFGPPSAEGFVPIRWPSGDYDIERLRHLSPLPSPDDEVEVVVKMLRGAVERIAEKGWVGSDDEVDLIDACRDYMEAEA